MRSKFKIIKTILYQSSKYSLEILISHLVPRDPDHITYGDACLEAAGGFFKDLK